MNYQLALITGASSGLGKELAHFLASQTIPLLLTGRNRSELENLKEELQKKVSVEIHVADLSSPLQRESLLELIYQKKPDLVINNAGYGLYGDVLTYTLEEQTSMLETNVNAVVDITIESARTLIKAEKKGTIVNISSAAGFFVYPTFAMYASTKAFVTQFSRSFHEEVSPLGVKVLTVCPGKIKTPFSKRASPDFQKPSKDHVMSVEMAVGLIWKQIQSQKSFTIIDIYYKVFCFVGRFLLPESVTQKMLKKGLEGRYQKKDLVL